MYVITWNMLDDMLDDIRCVESVMAFQEQNEEYVRVYGHWSRLSCRFLYQTILQIDSKTTTCAANQPEQVERWRRQRMELLTMDDHKCYYILIQN